MAIQSLNDMIASYSAGKYAKGVFQKRTVNAAASAAGRWHEFFTSTGIPAAGVFSGTAGAATQMLGTTQGALNVGNPSVSPDIKHLLNIKGQSPTSTLVPTTMYLVDFLLYYPSLTVTTGAGTVLNNTVTLPRYTNGDGVMAFTAVQTALGATQPVITITYTDQNGTTGNVAPASTSPAASAPISSIFTSDGSPFMALTGTDTGVRKIDSYSVASGTTGTVAMVLCKVLSEIDIYAINTGVRIDHLAQVPSLPKIEDNACLGFIGVAGGNMVTASLFSGTLDCVWG